ncbi:MAG: hypothetical protein LBR00_06310 [Clostridiales Family XIII bacterium]|jgi:hypothetical protein|nr:hypothetical protein [Clostridiales Family XIII bacterium]
MRKALGAVLAAALLLAACGAGGGGESPQRFLSIEGDVGQYVSYKTGTPVKDPAALPGDADFEGVALPEFLAGSEISGEPLAVWLCSSGDGFSVKLDWEGLDRAYMIFSEVNGWQCVAPEHPLSANAQDIDRIFVVSEGSGVGLRVVRLDGGVDVIPFGEILTSPLLASFHYEGRAENGDLASEVYTREASFSLADFYDAGDSGFEVVTAAGDRYLTDGAGRFAVFRQTFSYFETTGDEYEDVTEIRLR